MAFFFLIIGLVLTESNARYLLSGYNTLSETQRKKVDIKSYVPAFRKFHIFLAASFLIVGLIIAYVIGEDVAGIFMGVYPIVAYGYFMVISRKYFKGRNSRWQNVGLIVMAGALIFVTGVFYTGLRESRIVLTDGEITLTGSYGETLRAAAIERVELVTGLPEITLKTNGFALGKVRKGYFKTDDGTIVKLILNKDQSSYLLLTKADHSMIYFSAKDTSNEQVFNDMKTHLPDVVYK